MLYYSHTGIQYIFSTVHCSPLCGNYYEILSFQRLVVGKEDQLNYYLCNINVRSRTDCIYGLAYKEPTVYKSLTYTY